MSVLSKLKLVTAERVQVVSKTQQRRNKFIAQLEQQLALAKADLSGEPFTVMTTKRVQDKETGEVKVVKVPKLLKRWWWFDGNKKLMLRVKYGSKALALNSKGANAIELKSVNELLSVFDDLITAAQAGEFDAGIEHIAVRK